MPVNGDECTVTSINRGKCGLAEISYFCFSAIVSVGVVEI